MICGKTPGNIGQSLGETPMVGVEAAVTTKIQTIQTVPNKQKWFKCSLLVSRVYMEMV